MKLSTLFVTKMSQTQTYGAVLSFRCSSSAILETKLKHLAKIEALELQNEHDQLTELSAELTELLNNPRKRKNHMIKNIQSCVKDYGDDERTTLIERRPASKRSFSAPIPKDPVTIILSKNGWIKAAKGHEFDASQATFKSGDTLAASSRGFTHWPTVIFDQEGTAFSLPTHELPSVRSQGEPITTMVNPAKKLHPQLINASPDQDFLLASKLGYGFISPLAALTTHATSPVKKSYLYQVLILQTSYPFQMIQRILC